MRRDQDRLEDILAAIDNIERYSLQGKKTFETDELIQVWMIHYLQIIGEAARSTSLSMKSDHPEVQWEAIIGFRNIVVHEYFRIDIDVVWEVIVCDLPILKPRIKRILTELRGY